LGAAETRKRVAEAASMLKTDPRGAVAILSDALARAGSKPDAAHVAEELSRAWGRRRSQARAVHFARLAVRLDPEAKSAWSTLAKTCELVGVRTPTPRKSRRARALLREAASAFKRAAALASDPEDRRWLIELASDAARAAKSL
jgi:hypothetical protein